MNIHEYQSRDLLSKFGIPVPPGITVDNGPDAGKAFTALNEKYGTKLGVVKAQVYAGGRGKGGGRPQPGYMEKVIAAARDWGLPERYMRELEAHLAHRPAPGLKPALAEREALGKPEPGATGVRPRFATPFDRRD